MELSGDRQRVRGVNASVFSVSNPVHTVYPSNRATGLRRRGVLRFGTNFENSDALDHQPGRFSIPATIAHPLLFLRDVLSRTKPRPARPAGVAAQLLNKPPD